MRVNEREAHKRSYSGVRDDYDQRRWNDVDNSSWGLKSDHALGSRNYYMRDLSDYFEPDFDRTADRFGSDEDINQDFIESKGYAGVGPKGYERPNQLILEEVNEALYRHGGVDATNVEVSVENGIVTLDGDVPTREMKRTAEEAVEHVFGVRDVMNKLRVFGSGSGIRSVS